jgi:hypothetical protein
MLCILVYLDSTSFETADGDAALRADSPGEQQARAPLSRLLMVKTPMVITWCIQFSLFFW